MSRSPEENDKLVDEEVKDPVTLVATSQATATGEGDSEPSKPKNPPRPGGGS